MCDLLEECPTDAEWNTENRAQESIELRGNSLQFVLVSRDHPRGITGFYLQGVDNMSGLLYERFCPEAKLKGARNEEGQREKEEGREHFWQWGEDEILFRDAFWREHHLRVVHVFIFILLI